MPSKAGLTSLDSDLFGETNPRSLHTFRLAQWSAYSTDTFTDTAEARTTDTLPYRIRIPE